MRAEFYHRLLSDMPLLWRQLHSSVMPLLMLGAEGLARAIDRPSFSSAGLRVETELVAALLLD